MSIGVNSEPLEPATAFPYLGRTVAYNNSNWAALYHNLWKARRRWGVVGKVVTKTGATVRAQGILYKSIIQSVLLYGSNRWVVMGSMLKLLEVFHHWPVSRISGMTARRTIIREC